MAERLHYSSDVSDLDTSPDRPKGLKVVAGEKPTPLEDKARQVGTAVGKAVVTLRDARDTLKDIAGETREVAAIGIADAKNKATETSRRIRLRTSYIVREYPLHIVLAGGALGFLFGVGLRIWRPSR